MLDELFSRDKRMAMANARLRQAQPGYLAVHNFIDTYLQEYAGFNALSIEKIIASYNHFTKAYSQHLETFKETGEYPNDKGATFDKTTYDIALILSCVTDTPRFNIIQSLQSYIANIPAGTICVIGAGAGIELELIRQSGKTNPVTAYDFDFNDFLKNHFSGFNLRPEDFILAKDATAADTVFAIEIIEHIADYEALLKKVNLVMSAKAKLLCTTAANMPQFDHVHNLNDTRRFTTTLDSCGFDIVEQKRFSQHHVFSGIDSWNDWFVLEKKA